MKRFLFLSLGGACWVLGCGETINVRLTHSADPYMEEQCRLSVRAMGSFYAELVREEEGQTQSFQKCVEDLATTDQPDSLSQLESILAERLIFKEVPTGGRWTIWVEGFSAEACPRKGKAPLLCGRALDLSLPQPGAEIPIDVHCVGPNDVWAAEALETCRFK